MKSPRTVLAAFLLAVTATATAQGLLGPAVNDDQFLPVDQAFIFIAAADGGAQIALDWQIAPGYYLYRHRVSAKTATAGFTLGDIAMPAGKKKTDEFFGEVEVYYDALNATVPVTRPADCFDARDHCQLSGLRRGRALLSAGHQDRRDRAAAARHAVPRRRPADGRRAGSTRGPARDRQSADRDGDLLRWRARPRIHALRAADDPDPLRHHRRAGRGRDAARAHSCSP